MTKIKPKLYLNMSPQTQEEGSLAFARNMKVDDDGNLISDYGYKNITCTVSNDATPAVALNKYKIIGHIVGLDNKIYFFCATGSGTTWTDSKIIEYDEIANTAKKLSTNWTYSGGKISGCVNTNQSGEKILTIGEYDVPNQKKVPLKHINLSYPEVADESFYTQAPVVPITNLILKGTYVKTIPNGVYVFFIRYKIRKDVYTPWYICSSPIFAGTREKISTLQGGLSYINAHKDSAKSFIFAVNYIVPSNLRFYSEFQLGFIITHDEATDARIWKSFPTTILIKNTESNNTSDIYFDYEDIQEANIDDMLATTYEIFNVKNVTSFKNKLYIGNYEETDFSIDNDLSSLANNIKLYYDRVDSESISYKNITINNYNLNFDYSTGRYAIPSGHNFNYITGNLSNCFNTTISKLAKIETREKQDILKFDIGWKAKDNPDLCFVYNIYNYVYDNKLFGPSWEVNYNDARSCIRQIRKAGSDDNTLWTYTNNPGFQHPFYDKHLTFIYSSLPDNYSEVRSDHKRNKVFFFRDDTKIYTIHGYSGDDYGWLAKDRGFDSFARSAIDDNIVKEITNKNKIAIAYIELTYGAKVYKINSAIQRHSDYEDFLERIDKDNYCGYANEISFESTDYFTTGEPSSYLKTVISTYVSNVLNSYTRGFTEDCVPIVDLHDITGNLADVFPVNSVNVILKKWDFTVDSEDLEVDTDNYFKRFKVSLKITDYASVCSFSIKDNKYTFNTYDNLSTQASSLMPISKYKAYAHFVDNRNIITQGIEIPIAESPGSDTQATVTPPKHNFNDLIKLKYRYIRDINDTNPLYNKYKAFFISIVNVGNLVAECFGYTKKGTTHIVNCLEADTLLYNITDNISIEVFDGISQTVVATENAKYYSSGSSTPSLAFGNCGYIAWDDSDILGDTQEERNEIKDYLKTNTIYVVIPRDKTKENNYQLIKSSSYIPLIGLANNQYFELPGGFYGSYYCSVKKPDFGLSSRCYVSGNDVYGINRDTSLELSEFKSYIQLQTSPTYFITSNFNLNYLSLTEDITDKIFNIGSASYGIKEVAKVINSATLSYIYELKSMYKDFMNKKFKCSEDGYKTTFDNTVRVSNVLSDETFNNSVFKFGATDYYNIPTDRGIIESLFAIGNNIFAHTKGSLYKFDANQTIAASDTDITLKESEPFDIGISQVFDSQYGYGGINNKEAGCITFDSYFFYDRFTNHIFAYSGNGQIQIIDGNIYKFLKHYNFVECYALHDDINHRVLFDLKTSTGKRVCISYNYKAKAFISVHDIKLDKSFSTRNKCYSYNIDYNNNQNVCELFNTGAIETASLNSNLNLLKLYGTASGVCGIFFGTDTHALPDSCFNIAVVLPAVENIREVINNIKYIGDTIKDYIKSKYAINPEDEEDYSRYDLISNGEHTLYQAGKAVNPVQSIYIITDSCVSNIVNDTLDDTNRPNSLKSDPSIPAGLTNYKGIRHDIDGWNVNYFRNMLHKDNVYQYPNQPRAAQPVNVDNNSLVYGKYFIIVFNFITDKPIKMEELFISTSKY